MSKIDWQVDLEKKVANLLRKFRAEAEAHGAKLLVQVTVEVRDLQSNPTQNADNAGVVPTGDDGDVTEDKPKRKRKASKKVDDESES